MTQVISSNESFAKNSNYKDISSEPLSYNIRLPFHSLNSITKHLSGDFHKMDKYLIAEGVEEINKNISTLNHFIDQLFILSVAQQQDLKVIDSNFSIFEVFQNTISLYNSALKKKGNIYFIEPTNIKLFTDRDLLSTIFRNLIDNANKNTSGGEIKIAAIEDTTSILISISDTGTGMEPTLADELMKGNISNNNKIGYPLIHHMLQKINGYLSIKSTLNIGTVVTITLPKQSKNN